MEHIWTMEKWTKNPAITAEGRKTGLRLRFEKDVDPEVKKECLEFAEWLRKKYRFPVRVYVYVKSKRRIKANDGEYVCGTFWMPDDYFENPYVRLAAGDYSEMCSEIGSGNAIHEIILCMAHELTHYYQWINGVKLTPIGEERQAAKYSIYVLNEYSEYIDHKDVAQGTAHRGDG